MSDVPTAPTPPRPSVEPRRGIGIEELQSRILWVRDEVNVKIFEKYVSDLLTPMEVGAIFKA